MNIVEFEELICRDLDQNDWIFNDIEHCGLNLPVYVEVETLSEKSYISEIRTHSCAITFKDNLSILVAWGLKDRVFEENIFPNKEISVEYIGFFLWWNFGF